MKHCTGGSASDTSVAERESGAIAALARIRERSRRRQNVSDPCGHRVQLNVRVTLSAGKGAFGVIPEWVRGVAAGQMDESWINKHGQLDSKGGPWQNAFPKSRSLAGAKQV